MAVHYRGCNYCKSCLVSSHWKLFLQFIADFGVITAVQIAIAFIAYFIIPDLPRTTSWLSEEEKELAAWRLEEDIGEDDWIDGEQQSFYLGAKRAFLFVFLRIYHTPMKSCTANFCCSSDYKVWLLLGTVYGTTSAGSITNFFPALVPYFYRSPTVLLVMLMKLV